tara:strand:+ start:1325 stop:2050 length:726 start_codon:yes stop_codon:yes gene_type:complete
MIEERVIQQESVTSEEQPVAASETPTPPAAPEIPTVPLTEFEALKQQLASKDQQLQEKEKAFQNAKSKIGQYYDDRKKALEDQGMYKPLWEDANKTAQEKDRRIAELENELKTAQEQKQIEATRTTAMSALSNAGAINAGQTLSLLQDKLHKSSDGRTVILSGGVEQDLGTYVNNLKNPGSGWEHHFKASNSAGMGAKPSPTSNVAPGSENPWKTGNLTQQMILSNQDPDLAAVLQKEASQ